MSHALITGASSGIGTAFCRLFAAHRINIVATASPRSLPELQALAAELRVRHGVDVRVVVSDLAEPDGVSKLMAFVKAEGVTLDYLINNAGFGIVGQKVHEYDMKRMRDMLQVNVMALSELVLNVVPGMVARGKGRVLNVSSIAGYILPHGLEAGYSASKAYVVSFSEGLADDLRGTGVTCTHLAPGPVATRFFSTAGLKDESRVSRLYMTPQVVARQGFDALMRGRTMVMPGWSNKFMRLAALYSPSKWLVARISGALVTPP